MMTEGGIPVHDSLREALRGDPAPEDQQRWLDLLGRLDVDALTDRFLELLVDVPGYDPAPIPLSEIRRTGRMSFVSLIAGLRAGGLHEQLPVAEEVGVSRARARIPITSLMTAIRLDFRVLWDALTRVAKPSDAQLVVRHTSVVLSTVDEYVTQTQTAYVTERQRMHDEASSVRQGVIASLFQVPAPTDERLLEIADELGVALDAPLTVAAAGGADIPALRVFIAESERRGLPMSTHHFGDMLIVFSDRFESGAAGGELLTRLLGLRVGIAQAPTGLRSLHQASTTARDLAQLLAADEEGAMTWSRGWARLASRGLIAAGRPLLADVHASLASCGEAERARLEEAARAYLRTGSIGDTATRLYCHRNTVTNRLRRFAEITGVDPLVPAQAARLVIGWA